MKSARVIPLYLLTAAMTLSACVTSSERGASFTLSPNGYATQKKAPIPSDYTQDSPVISFPEIIGDGDPLENAEALSQKVFEIFPSTYESSYNIKENTLNVSLGLTTAEFAKTDIPFPYRTASNIRFRLLPDVLSENPLHPDLKKHMRAFEISPTFNGIVLTSLTLGHIQLEDGCLYLGKNSRENAVMFRREAGLRIDDEGYVEIYNRILSKTKGVRPGNKFGWGDGTRDVSDTEAGKKLITACKSNAAFVIGMPFYQ